MNSQKFGCIGKTLKHSYSEKIHRLLSPKYSYSLWELEDETVLDSFMKKRDFDGLNVTIPYKKAVIPYLDELSDTAKKIGAVNTVYKKDGRLYGDNTDYYGLKSLIEKYCIVIKNKNVLILGTGGTSETALCVCRDMGAKSVYRVSREKRACDIISYTEAEKKSDTNVIINTTPVGMYPDIEKMPIDISYFPYLSGVVDCIYNPKRTNLIIEAERRNINAAPGLYMLIKQAQLSSEIFTNCKHDCNFINSIYSSVLKTTQNLVLIGMPGCGKSSIGKVFSDECRFIDTDTVLEKEFGMSILDYFNKYGEKAFREKEKSLITDKLKYTTSTVISTGGGGILDKDNVKALKRNGILIYLKKSKENLVISDSRPLSSSKEYLDKLYSEREKIYESTADYIIDIDNLSCEDGVRKIKEMIYTKSKNILVINGPNMNMLGIREREIYGTKTYCDLISQITKYCKENNISVNCVQSNYEGDIIEFIQMAKDNYDGIVINPAGYTHTSVAIADAIAAVNIPTVEVHISNPDEREDFRKISYVRKYCISEIKGMGFDGYIEAIKLLCK